MSSLPPTQDGRDEMEIEVPTISLHLESTNSSSSHSLIFFITGNPGLIGYYDVFLNTLHNLLSAGRPKSNIHIYGQSLAGFESQTTSKPYTLEAQIQILLHSLKNQVIPTGPHKNQPYNSIILIGHSVGTYILLELIRRLHASSSPINITAGILLFATVTHISQSPSGVKITSLFRIPDFPRRAHVAAKAFISLLPERALRWLIGAITGMPAGPVEVTKRFLTSRIGVWQALSMAKDEMATITEDKWGEEIWGVEHEDEDSKWKVPKLVFYFGQNDHWVADHTRDALIAARGQFDDANLGSKPLMLIDQHNVPHGFCIDHSEIIAEKVAVWVADILESQA